MIEIGVLFPSVPAVARIEAACFASLAKDKILISISAFICIFIAVLPYTTVPDLSSPQNCTLMRNINNAN
jgi:hypothetical protein